LRLKGEVDDLNMEVSLNVLFDVLLKVNVLLSPIVPFFTENMYQNLRLVINKESKFYSQSIHLLFIAEVNNYLLNEKVIE
jgi:isoleucyl-tRNA synthetase